MRLKSSLTRPLPVVTTLERPPQSRINDLRRNYHDICADGHADMKLRSRFYHALIDGVFLFLGSDSQRFPKCFANCISVCKFTKVLQARSWNAWEGFTRILKAIEKAERLTRHSNLLHCPAAPYLVVAIAMQQVTLHNKIGERDKVSQFFRDFDCHNKAATAIYFYEQNYRQDVLTLDQVWDVTPFAIQLAPTRTIDQLSTRTLGQEMPTPRHQAPREVIILDDEQITVKRESPAAYQAPEFREEGREEAMPMPRQVQAPAPPTVTMPISMPVPVQMATPTLVPISTPTSIPTLMPSMVRETLKEVFRGDVMMQLQPLLDRLKSENWNGVIQRDIMQVLNDRNVRVLPTFAKNMLNMWATRSQNAMLLSWLEQARDDVDVLQWTERYVEPIPSAWTNPQSAHNVFHELDVLITGIPQLTIRGPLQAKMSTLRDIFDQQERTHKDEVLFRVDNLQMGIAKLHDQMAESKQTEGQAAGGLAAVGDYTARTDKNFAVRIIETVEDDTDLYEDSEEPEGRKKKKKKKRKAEEKLPGKKNGERAENEKKPTKKKTKKEKKTQSGEKKKKRSHREMMEDD